MITWQQDLHLVTHLTSSLLLPFCHYKCLLSFLVSLYGQLVSQVSCSHSDL